MTQVDVRTEFFNGILDKDIWIKSPYGVPYLPAKTYKLIKAIYGPKQPHLMLHRQLCEDLAGLQFKETPNEPCVFRSSRPCCGVSIFLLLYMDDVLILALSKEQATDVVERLNRPYNVWSCDTLEWLLSVKLNWRMGSEGICNLVFIPSRNILPECYDDLEWKIIGQCQLR